MLTFIRYDGIDIRIEAAVVACMCRPSSSVLRCEICSYEGYKLFYLPWYSITHHYSRPINVLLPHVSHLSQAMSDHYLSLIRQSDLALAILASF
jgi:hypothetical protein